MDPIKKHFKNYWKYYLLFGLLMIAYGSFLGMIFAISEDTLDTLPSTPDSASACTLEKTPLALTACKYGYKGGQEVTYKSFIKEGILTFPTFERLRPVCEKYYDNSTLAGSCVSGAVSGAQDKIERLWNLHYLSNQNGKNSALKAAIGIIIAMGFCAIGYKYGRADKTKEEQPLNEEKALLDLDRDRDFNI